MNISQSEVLQTIAMALECEPESLNLNSALGQHYNWDSFGHLSIMVALEQKYNIEISEENIIRLQSVNDIINFLSDK
ncbi:acyl carrier protein [Pedobacter punctiformis]|uniref:Acyl carrier protein n=1 Tax=Pedobacter punctiformis TaxID=3004097 RepID=A0ABT4L8J0_9SPHI|nr:acyl carrier protein [Pedobacter sp. HCMS5-2]MCZ4244151.1 acyl carrier protein [Pedobacter sp. HCMS5-2]